MVPVLTVTVDIGILDLIITGAVIMAFTMVVIIIGITVRGMSQGIIPVTVGIMDPLIECLMARFTEIVMAHRVDHIHQIVSMALVADHMEEVISGCFKNDNGQNYSLIFMGGGSFDGRMPRIC